MQNYLKIFAYIKKKQYICSGFGYTKVTLQNKVLMNWHFENELKGYITITI